MELRGAPARKFEAIRQRLKALPPCVVVMQHDDDGLDDEAKKLLCTQHSNQGGEGRIRAGTPVSASGPICPDSSGRLPNQEKTSISTVRLPDRLRKLQLNLPLLGSNEQDQHDDGTELSLIKSCNKSYVKCSCPKQGSIMRATKTECCESIFLRWPGVIGKKCCHLNSGKYSSRDNWVWMNPRTDDETETVRALSEREKRGLFPTASRSRTSTAHRVGTRSESRTSETRSNTVCYQRHALSNM